MPGGHLVQPLPRADHTGFGCLGPDHLNFEHFQGWRFHSLSGQLFPVFDHPRGVVAGFFQVSNQIFLWWPLCPLPFILSLCTSKKSLAPSLYHPIR